MQEIEVVNEYRKYLGVFKYHCCLPNSTTRKSKISEGRRKKWNTSQILWSQNLVTELERDFTFSLT